MTLEEQKEYLRNLSVTELLQMGTEDVAYIRKVEYMGDVHFSIHTADGQAISVTSERDKAEYLIESCDWKVMPLH